MSGDERRTCLLCGHEGYDVRPGITEVEDPQPVEVELPAASRDGAVVERHVVPGRYLAGTYCVDRAACRKRRAEQITDVAVAQFFAGVEVEP